MSAVDKPLGLRTALICHADDHLNRVALANWLASSVISSALCGIRVLFTSEPRTKAWTVDDCLCLGRYSVLALDPAVWARQVVAGSAVARTSAYLAWEAKKVLKRVGGEAWLKLRARLLPN